MPIHLEHSQNQHLNLTQQTIMSAHMQQALRLLQLPLQELEPFIEEQVVLNPVLEIDDSNESLNDEEEEPEEEEEENKELSISEGDLSILSHLERDMADHFSQDDSPLLKQSSDEVRLKNFLEESIHSEITLSEQLTRQSHETFDHPEELAIAEIIIGYIDAFGFLKTPLEEIAALHSFSLTTLKMVLEEIQSFEPFGIGASTIQESLLIQLRCQKKEKSLAYQMIQHHYDDLLHHSIRSIQKKIKCSFEEIEEAIEKDIAKLDLHPGTHFSSRPNQIIIPDVTLRLENEELVVNVEREFAPALRLNHRYLKMLEDPEVPVETKRFIKSHIFSARWLVKNLQQRYSTVERIAESLAKRQYRFFTEPEGTLIPLNMKTIADELNLHESTIARTVSNKYLFCPRGLFPLKTFFTNKLVSEDGEDLSSRTVKDALLRLIEGENKQKPLSDEKLSFLLKEQGIVCARRTVAKYRMTFEIGNTQQRRKFSS